jgi:flagellin-like hook-associated protein FlgL
MSVDAAKTRLRKALSAIGHAQSALRRRINQARDADVNVSSLRSALVELDVAESDIKKAMIELGR